MFFKNLSNAKSTYIVFFIYVLFLNIFFNSTLYADSLKISEVEVSEPFNLNFNKKKVFDKAFKKAFFQLSKMITDSQNQKKLQTTSLNEIKRLINSFNIRNEKFVNDEYFATFNVNFNKKNTYNFFEKKKIFPSIPKKISLLLIPVLIEIDNNQLITFSDNVVYKNWNKELSTSDLINYILPTEDIEDIEILSANIKELEDYDFKEIIKKYDISNYIIVILHKDKKNIKILSKIKINENLKTINTIYPSVNFSNEDSLKKFIKELKKIYEDNWKNLNKINTSIKLPLTISLKSNDHEKIKLFEKAMEKLDLVFSFKIISFDNQNILYKIIYNGSPNNFIKDMNSEKISIVKNNQLWEVK